MQQLPLDGIDSHAECLQGRRSQDRAFPCFSKNYGRANRHAVQSQQKVAGFALHSTPVGQQEAATSERRNADGLER